jgi:predicted amidophosphoribosyltransferase
MSFPIKTCVVCGEEFELKPDKPGFANRCPECSAPEAEEPDDKKRNLSAEERKAEAEANAERRKAIRDLLYKKDR